MSEPHLDASLAGTFAIGGDMPITRLGFGAMRITGPNIWGPPENPEEAKHLLKRLPDLGINFIDTADAYGPNVSEELLAQALHPFTGLTIATKGGLIRPDNSGSGWPVIGRPDYLRHAVQSSLRRLKVDRIDLWQLHRIDPTVPMEDQFGVISDMQREGLIRHAGLSEVSIEEIKVAQRHFKVATVQNLYNLANRQHENVVDYCDAHGIGFIPWFPLAAGGLARPGGVLHAVAKAHGASASQVALAWILRRSKVILPIPGTSKIAHLEENVAAAALTLTQVDMDALNHPIAAGS